MRKIYYSIVVRHPKVCARGYVIFQDGNFEGVMAYDYIQGSYNENGILSFEISEGIGVSEYVYQNPVYTFIQAQAKIGGLELPGKYTLQEPIGNQLTIEFLQSIKNPTKQKEIDEEIAKAKKFRCPA